MRKKRFKNPIEKFRTATFPKGHPMVTVIGKDERCFTLVRESVGGTPLYVFEVEKCQEKKT